MAKIILTPKQRLQQAHRRMRERRFRDLTQEMSAEISNMIFGGLKQGKTYTEIASKINKKYELGADRAKIITRTESHEIRGIATEIQYRETDPLGEKKYRWLGPTDKRTSPLCLAIKKRTVKGVPLDTLKQIIIEEARRYNPQWIVKEWTPHPNCRHVPSRVF